MDELLRRLPAAGFERAPRIRPDGTRTWIEGEVPTAGPYHLSDARIVSATQLIRAFHDATTRTGLTAGQEIVAHNDLGPHNTVFAGDEAVGLIDFDDDVAPGARADDFAHAAWGFADLTDPAVPRPEQLRKLNLMCATYGDITPAQTLDALAARFERAITQHRAANRPAAVHIFEDFRARLEELR
ncbi:phosphotransferase [Actinoplanes sp. NPDC051470]|uniref:phosphotransferase n=1 Tax=Actinoplanes sp. NPDC051470 TaxID=3157224 RepID=UPI00343665E6